VAEKKISRLMGRRASVILGSSVSEAARRGGRERPSPNQVISWKSIKADRQNKISVKTPTTGKRDQQISKRKKKKGKGETLKGEQRLISLQKPRGGQEFGVAYAQDVIPLPTSRSGTYPARP